MLHLAGTGLQVAGTVCVQLGGTETKIYIFFNNLMTNRQHMVQTDFSNTKQHFFCLDGMMEPRLHIAKPKLT